MSKLLPLDLFIRQALLYPLTSPFLPPENKVLKDYSYAAGKKTGSLICPVILDLFEYPNNAAAQLAYVSSDDYGADITSGQTYNASSQRLEFVPANAFADDGRDTIWIPASGSITNQWISVQWGTGKIIKKIRLLGHVADASPRHCKLEGSNNGTDWIKIPADGWDGTYATQYNTDEFEYAHTIEWCWVTFNNSTPFTYYRIFITDNWYDPTWIYLAEVEMMEGGAGSGNLACFSEGTIVQQGTYSLKGIAKVTDSLNDTLTRTLLQTVDLTGKDTWVFYIRSSRIGSNIKVGLRDSGEVTTETTPNITSAGAWQKVEVDISGVADADKNTIDKRIITIVNADAENVFYIDNMKAA